MGFGGINVRESGDRLVFRVFLLDGDGRPVTDGDTLLYLYELQGDGSLRTYDFSDHSFKVEEVTTETTAMTHRAGNGGLTDTGLWTAVLTITAGLTRGRVYVALVKNPLAYPSVEAREFQYGNGEGDLDSDELHLVKAALVNKREHTIETGVNVIKDDDGVTTLRTLTPDESDGVVRITPS